MLNNVCNDHFVLHAQQRSDALGHPSTHHLQVDLFDIHVLVILFGELHCLEQLFRFAEVEGEQPRSCHAPVLLQQRTLSIDHLALQKYP